MFLTTSQSGPLRADGREGGEPGLDVTDVCGIGRRDAQFLDDGQEVVEGADWSEGCSGFRANYTACTSQDEGGAGEFEGDLLSEERPGQDAIGGPGPARSVWKIEVGAEETGDVAVLGIGECGGAHLRRRRVSASRLLSKVR